MNRCPTVPVAPRTATLILLAGGEVRTVSMVAVWAV